MEGFDSAHKTNLSATQPIDANHYFKNELLE